MAVYSGKILFCININPFPSSVLGLQVTTPSVSNSSSRAFVTLTARDCYDVGIRRIVNHSAEILRKVVAPKDRMTDTSTVLDWHIALNVRSDPQHLYSRPELLIPDNAFTITTSRWRRIRFQYWTPSYRHLFIMIIHALNS